MGEVGGEDRGKQFDHGFLMFQGRFRGATALPCLSCPDAFVLTGQVYQRRSAGVRACER
jgi:hypothetical protein